MKKLFVLFLVLAMLIPMGLVATAEETVAAKPFYAFGWSDLDNEKYPNLDGQVTASLSSKGDTVTLSYGGTSNPEKMAEKIKEKMLSRPEGARFFSIFGPGKAYAINENVVYLDKGADQAKKLVADLFDALAAIDCPIDGMTIDVEWVHMNSYYIHKDTYSKDNLLYDKIVNDPRYETDIRPMLVERGFPFYKNVTEVTPEIYSIAVSTGEYAGASAIWDAVMAERLNAYNNSIFFEPLQKYYPEAPFFDYIVAQEKTWFKVLNQYGNATATGGNVGTTGNVSNISAYNRNPGSYFWMNQKGELEFKKPASYYPAYYERCPYNFFQFDAITFKQTYAASDTKGFSLWLAEYDYNTNGVHTSATATDTDGRIDGTPYYTEMIFHAGMLDAKAFMVYMFKPEFDDEQYDRYSRVISEIMSELTRVAGYADRKPIELPINWNSEFVLSGMYANGRNLWRITPNTAITSVEDFKVEGDDPTFSIAGQTVTFPGGKIIADGTISEVGTCGYWVETAKDVIPTITTVADRYEQYPSFLENFDSYDVNWQFNTMEAKDTGAWNMKIDSKNKPVVVDNNGTKALSLAGNNTLKNVEHVEKITAGDSYAEQQVWELTLTLPEGLDGEVVFFNTNGKKDDAKDGGFKIAGGKIYYNENGEYKELCDAKAGTYTFKRVVNFKNADAFKSSYYVYDTAGKELAAAKNVAMVTFKLPVTTIEVSVKDVTKAVLLDNYKLYPLGVTTELELYEAKFGWEIEDITAASSEDTAYRLSWMNAADAEYTAKLMYDVYEGDKAVSTGTVIKEIKMAPGTDGVEIGVLEVKDGQSIKVYVQSDAPADDSGNSGNPNNPDIPDNEDGDEAQGGMDTTLLIIIIVSAVLAVAIIVAAVLLTKPKKAKTAGTPANDAIAENAIPEGNTENTKEKTQE